MEVVSQLKCSSLELTMYVCPCVHLRACVCAHVCVSVCVSVLVTLRVKQSIYPQVLLCFTEGMLQSFNR